MKRVIKFSENSSYHVEKPRIQNVLTVSCQGVHPPLATMEWGMSKEEWSKNESKEDESRVGENNYNSD